MWHKDGRQRPPGPTLRPSIILAILWQLVMTSSLLSQMGTWHGWVAVSQEEVWGTSGGVVGRTSERAILARSKGGEATATRAVNVPAGKLLPDSPAGSRQAGWGTTRRLPARPKCPFPRVASFPPFSNKHAFILPNGLLLTW